MCMVLHILTAHGSSYGLLYNHNQGNCEKECAYYSGFVIFLLYLQ